MQINIKYSADKLTDMIDWSLSALLVYLFTSKGPRQAFLLSDSCRSTLIQAPPA
jgi:hypothetical protein